MCRVGAAALVVLLVAGTTSASAQDSPLADARLAGVRGRLEAAVHGADAAGIPSDWILLKVREGLAKHAPPDRIAAAAELVLTRLRTAQSVARLMPPTSRREERLAVLRALHDALAAGAPPGELGPLVRSIVSADPARAQRDVVLGLGIVAELGERGFDGAAAARAARAAHGRAGARGWQALLRSAQAIRGGNDTDRGQRLEQAARQVERDAERAERHDDSNGNAGQPADRGGPPHDDAFEQGRGRGSGGRGRAR